MNATVRVANSRPPCLPIICFLSAQISAHPCGLASPLLVVFLCDPRFGNRNCDRTAHTEVTGLAAKNQEATCLSICNPSFILLKFAHKMKIIIATISLLANGLLESAQRGERSCDRMGRSRNKGGDCRVCKESLPISLTGLMPHGQESANS